MIDRRFELIGLRLIDCSKHCPALQEGEGHIQAVYTAADIEGVKISPPILSAYLPVCTAQDAPLQGESLKPKIDKDLLPSNVNRVCVYWARQAGISVEEQKV